MPKKKAYALLLEDIDDSSSSDSSYNPTDLSVCSEDFTDSTEDSTDSGESFLEEQIKKKKDGHYKETNSNNNNENIATNNSVLCDQFNRECRQSTRKKCIPKENDLSIVDNNILHKDKPESPKFVYVSKSAKSYKICGVCLKDTTTQMNGLLECDHCSISVHEYCYSVPGDNNSIASNESTSLTEAWFCDPCRAGVTNPHCVVCPNNGCGVFKELDTGNWIHMICALYVPKVKFIKMGKMSLASLSNVPPVSWGAKSCELCEEDDLTRVGLTINCEAGLCKTYFHPVCAQKKGLLEDFDEENVGSLVPYFGYCHGHTNKYIAVERKKKSIIFAELVKQLRLERAKVDVNDPYQMRINQKLKEARENYKTKRASMSLHIRPTVASRDLSTSTTAIGRFQAKAKVMGFDLNQAKKNELKNSLIGSIGKRENVAPSLSVEFSAYYYDRADRVNDIKESIEVLLEDKKAIIEQQAKTMKNSISQKERHEKLTSSQNSTLNSIFLLHNQLVGLCPELLLKSNRLIPESDIDMQSLVKNKMSEQFCMAGRQENLTNIDNEENKNRNDEADPMIRKSKQSVSKLIEEVPARKGKIQQLKPNVDPRKLKTNIDKSLVELNQLNNKEKEMQSTTTTHTNQANKEYNQLEYPNRGKNVKVAGKIVQTKNQELLPFTQVYCHGWDYLKQNINNSNINKSATFNSNYIIPTLFNSNSNNFNNTSDNTMDPTSTKANYKMPYSGPISNLTQNYETISENGIPSELLFDCAFEKESVGTEESNIVQSNVNPFMKDFTVNINPTGKKKFTSQLGKSEFPTKNNYSYAKHEENNSNTTGRVTRMRRAATLTSQPQTTTSQEATDTAAAVNKLPKRNYTRKPKFYGNK